MNGAIRMAELALLLPMHLLLDEEGAIVSAGPTLRKLIGPARQLEDAFRLERPYVPPGGQAALAIAGAARGGKRIFLRQNAAPRVLLRGHAVAVAGGAQLLLNLGFGIGLPQSVRQFGLTDADFAPSDLAMELLFLHEANQTAIAALSRSNAALDEARQTAEAESLTDPLTQLANRRGLDAALAAALQAARPGGASPGQDRRRFGGTPFALVHVDLDGFKAVNDRFGHAAGDRVLTEVARILREEIRATDTAARPGGDEFALVLPGVTEEAALRELGRRILARIEAPIAVAGGTARISASIGIALSAAYSRPEAETMAADADAALYAIKHEGGGQVAFGPTPGRLAAASAGPAAPVIGHPARRAASVG